ncbi:MAG: hydrogenase iron-sulfur subunit [Pelotomaculaceae bacterium]
MKGSVFEDSKKTPGTGRPLVIELPTTGALRLEWILEAFEAGAAEVAVLACRSGLTLWGRRSRPGRSGGQDRENPGRSRLFTSAALLRPPGQVGPPSLQRLIRLLPVLF